MASRIVYLHIPKSGGTSQRTILVDLYGEESVYWHGISNVLHGETCDPSSMNQYSVIGGHHPLSWYPEQLDALFIAVIREPISRVVSLYSYYTRPDLGEPQTRSQRRDIFNLWQQRGMDSNSLVASLEKCPEFRQEVENFQCLYLSRHGGTFAGVMQTLAATSAAVCDVDSVDALNALLSDRLGWGEVPPRRLNRSLERAHEMIMQEPGVEEVLTGLLDEDLRLYRFIREQHGGLYDGMKFDEGLEKLRPRKPFDSSSDPGPPWMGLQIYTKGYIGIRADGTGTTGIAIVNGSQADMDARRYSNLEICYSVHDSAGEQLGPGVFRTALDQSVRCGDTLIWELPVRLPAGIVKSAARINVWLSVSATESVADMNPFHAGSMQVWHIT